VSGERFGLAQVPIQLFNAPTREETQLLLMAVLGDALLLVEWRIYFAAQLGIQLKAFVLDVVRYCPLLNKGLPLGVVG
jgi:hypothetical protein